jgi:hypothetical protein
MFKFPLYVELSQFGIPQTSTVIRQPRLLAWDCCLTIAEMAPALSLVAIVPVKGELQQSYHGNANLGAAVVVPLQYPCLPMSHHW